MSNELTHYGVLGMRWGHRKNKTKTSKSTDGEKTNAKGKKVAKAILIGVGGLTTINVTAALGGHLAGKYFGKHVFDDNPSKTTQIISQWVENELRKGS